MPHFLEVLKVVACQQTLMISNTVEGIVGRFHAGNTERQTHNAATAQSHPKLPGWSCSSSFQEEDYNLLIYGSLISISTFLRVLIETPLNIYEISFMCTLYICCFSAPSQRPRIISSVRSGSRYIITWDHVKAMSNESAVEGYKV